MFRDSKLNTHLLIVPKESLLEFFRMRDHKRNKRRLDRWWERLEERKAEGWFQEYGETWRNAQTVEWELGSETWRK